MKSEDEIQQLIMMEAPKHGSLLLRNNSGAFKDLTGRQIRYGLGNSSKKINSNFKSSDLIGLTTVRITPDMVGKTIGVFTCVEIKKEGWKFMGDSRETAQNNFINWAKSKGGIGFFCNSVESFIKNIKCL